MTDYITVEDLKEYLGNVQHSNLDSVCELAVSTASRAIEAHCGRRFYPDDTATARTYRVVDPYCVIVDDFWTTTGLAIASDNGNDGTYETTWASTEYTLYPLNQIRAGQEGWAYNEIRTNGTRWFPCSTHRTSLQVTAKWGWEEVPAQVQNATKLYAARLVQRSNSPEGIAGGFETAIRVSSRIDPDVSILLAPFKRPFG
jgi:hypothetical protein